MVRNDSPMRGSDLNNSSFGVFNNAAVGDRHANIDFIAADILSEPGRRCRLAVRFGLIVCTPAFWMEDGGAFCFSSYIGGAEACSASVSTFFDCLDMITTDVTSTAENKARPVANLSDRERLVGRRRAVATERMCSNSGAVARSAVTKSRNSCRILFSSPFRFI